MNRRELTKVLAALCLGGTPLASHSAHAQQKEPPPTLPGQNKDPQSTFEPRSGPGEGQKIMERMVGEWDVVKSIFPVGKDPVRTKGTCHQGMVNAGLFLHSQFTFVDAEGKPSIGVGILGFDSKTGQFTSVWLDERSTSFSFRQSDGKFDGEQVILYGKSLDSKNPPRMSRSVAYLENNGKTLIHQQYVPGPDGKERVIMELRMTRKEPTPKSGETPKTNP